VLSAIRYRTEGEGGAEGVGLGNPVELGQAFLLAAFFAGILVLARYAQARLGTTGLWMAGAVGGLLDVDSVAISAARLHSDGVASIEAGAGTYLLATLTNLVVKGAAVVVVGGRDFARLMLPAFLALALLTVGLLFV
jgi:uncharacterized membrane protein (DUF4010 family)